MEMGNIDDITAKTRMKIKMWAISIFKAFFWLNMLSEIVHYVPGSKSRAVDSA